MMTLEELSDIEEIKSVRVRYSLYYDGGELDKLVELFCDDAVCEFPAEFGGDWRGKEQIRENFKRWVKPQGQRFSALHALANARVTLTGKDTAIGQAYLIDLHTGEELAMPVHLVGLYDDAYERTAGGWRLKRARLDVLWPRRSAP